MLASEFGSSSVIHQALLAAHEFFGSPGGEGITEHLWGDLVIWSNARTARDGFDNEVDPSWADREDQWVYAVVRAMQRERPGQAFAHRERAPSDALTRLTMAYMQKAVLARREIHVIPAKRGDFVPLEATVEHASDERSPTWRVGVDEQRLALFAREGSTECLLRGRIRDGD